MPFLRISRSPKETQSKDNQKEQAPKPAPYRHIPTHAGRDARSQIPPSSRETDRWAITEQHRLRSQKAPETRPSGLPAVSTIYRGNHWNSKEWSMTMTRQGPRPQAFPNPGIIVQDEQITPTSTAPQLAFRPMKFQLESESEMSSGYTSDHSSIAGSISSRISSVFEMPISNNPPPLQLRHHARTNGTEIPTLQQPHLRLAIPTERPRNTDSTRHVTFEPTAPRLARPLAIRQPSSPLALDPRFLDPARSGQRGQRLRSTAPTLKEELLPPPWLLPPPPVPKKDSAYAAFPMPPSRPYSKDRLRPWLAGPRQNGGASGMPGASLIPETKENKETQSMTAKGNA